MKIRIEVDEKIKEDEVIVRCSQLNEEVTNIQKAITDIISQKTQITFYKDNIEYYICLSEILFFETEDANISAHTIDNIYQVKYKLYELEQILPNNFMRISKSTILNINHIYSITRNLNHQALLNLKIHINKCMFQGIIISH